MDAALEWGLEEADFQTDFGRGLFAHMTTFKRDPRSKGAQLGPNAFKELYSTFEFCHDDGMTLEAYCTLVRKNRLRIEAQALARTLVDESDHGDPMDAMQKAREHLDMQISLGYGMQTDVQFHTSLGRTIERHDLLASGADLSVAKYPWDPFNTITMGIQPDDYIVLYGRPKSMKSWVLAFFIADIYNQGKVPLIYTKEMTADNIFMRVAACIAGLPYQDLRTGKLSKDDRERLQYVSDLARDLQKQQNMICLSAKDAPRGCDTVEWLQSKVKKYHPDVTAIDGLYLMSDSAGGRRQKDNNRVMNISRATRQMVFETETPVLATMQATRTAAAHKNANLDEIAYSDAISQDVTAAMRIINEEESQTITIAFGGSREFRFSGCRIHGIPATNFGWIEALNQRDVDRIKQRDDRADEKDSPTTAGRQPVTNGKAHPPVDPVEARKKAVQQNRQLGMHRLNNLLPP